MSAFGHAFAIVDRRCGLRLNLSSNTICLSIHRIINVCKMTVKILEQKIDFTWYDSLCHSPFQCNQEVTFF